VARTKNPNHRPNRRTVRHNVRPGLILLLLPLLGGLAVIAVFASGLYNKSLSAAGDKRLETQNWQQAKDVFENRQPTYERKYAYYKMKVGQTLTSVADYFSVSEAELTKLNPGMAVAGTTIKVPPVTQPLAPAAGPNGKIFQAVVVDDHGFLRITQQYSADQIITNIPDLMAFLKPYDAIQQTGPTTYRINRSISLEGNIRLDITDQTVTKLELRSAPHDITCLCFDESSALLKNVAITTYDPATNQPDKNYADERAFVRDKNGRMDAINVHFSYLGNDLLPTESRATRTNPVQLEGGTYGVSWRISDDMLGQEIATGWVEHSQFDHNHFGAFSFGASGMTWRNNLFTHNEIYGLDPHDDSNNALIEDNVFSYNGKHGFIVSKRCDYNIIRNNLSIGNKLHGFMLHQDSDYNVIENNVAYGNTDNYVIYASDYNTIRGNIGYNAKSSQVRINEGSRNNYVQDNSLEGGRRGVYIYGDAENVYITGNTFRVGKEVLTTDKSKNIFFGGNTIPGLRYKIGSSDRLIFGGNTIDGTSADVPAMPPLPKNYTVTDRP
jgi:parallel beta-helix repeat protein